MQQARVWVHVSPRASRAIKRSRNRRDRQAGRLAVRFHEQRPDDVALYHRRVSRLDTFAIT